jgi:hypothetical protein
MVAIGRLRALGWTGAQIAEHVGVSRATTARTLQQLGVARTTRDATITGHAEKALNFARHLERLIRSGVLNAGDSHLARILRNDLTNASRREVADESPIEI